MKVSSFRIYRSCVSALLLALTTLLAEDNAPQLTYHLSMPEPHTHYFNVEINVQEFRDSVAIFKLPVWTPGSYLVREFARNVQDVEAFDKRDKLPIGKTDKNTWLVRTHGHSQFTLRYRVYAYEQSVRTSFLNESRGFVNGASMFFFLSGYEHLAGELRIHLYKKWRTISTGLSKIHRKTRTYRFPNYDILVDSPILMGNHKVLKFDVENVPHEIAIYGKGNMDDKRFAEDVERIVRATKDLFGSLPYDKYVFIILLLEKSRGGLEHLNSTSIEIPRWVFSSEEKYKNVLTLITHEFFHTWNVKRIRPIALGPFDYVHENYTKDLWVAEGITSYYEFPLLLRARLFTIDDFFKYLAKEIKSVEMTPGRHVQSLTEASFDTWIKFYRQNENSPNSQISYYTKGSLIGFMLDLAIIESTDGEKSFDDVFTTLYGELYKEKARGYTSAEFRQICESIAGRKLDDIWQVVDGTDDLDYDTYLRAVGYRLVRRYREDSSETTPYFGFRMTTNDGQTIVTTVYTGTAAYDGGLNVNDEIIAVDNVRVDEQLLQERLKEATIGKPVTFLVSREGLMRELEIVPRQSPLNTFTIEKVESPSDEQKRLFEKWLGVQWEK